MFLIKLLISFMLISFIGAAKCLADKQKEIDCTITRKCSTSEDIVYATDGEQCYLFRNPCIFGTEMCMRRANKKDEYKVVDEKTCKKYCGEFCTEEYAPVCGEYNNEYKEFSNECDFYKHSCQNNQSYIFLHVGKCDQAVAA
ncbi:double-headed protease inhibitor, submandibular gland [Cochliomyia hominivorax]